MNIAVVLAAGSGSRIASDTPKQYIEILGKPILAYTLEIFETNKKITLFNTKLTFNKKSTPIFSDQSAKSIN